MLTRAAHNAIVVFMEEDEITGFGCIDIASQR